LVATDEEDGLAVLPALEDVGAAGLLAHGVQALALNQAAKLGVLRTHGRPYLDPRRLPLDRGCGVARLDAEHPATFRHHGGHVTERTPGKRASGTPEARTRRGSRSRATPQWTRSLPRWRSTTGSASATVTGRPNSAVSEVTPASLMPHGTIR